MKTKYIIYTLLSIIVLTCASVFPIEGNFKVNSIDEKNGMMNVTYSSLLPFVQRDTIVKAPILIYGKVIEHKKFQTSKGFAYLTVTNVKGVNYVFEDEKTWKYIEMNAKDSIFTCEERFWPEHYVITIPD